MNRRRLLQVFLVLTPAMIGAAVSAWPFVCSLRPGAPPPVNSQLSYAFVWTAAVSGVLFILIFVAPYVLDLSERWSRRSRRRRAGLCVRCGYDLRASPLRCPECGEPNATSKWYEIADSDVGS